MNFLSMEFVTKYFWVIVIGIICFLALIGFIADKTGFLSKKKDLKDTPKKDEEKTLDVQNLERGLNDALSSATKEQDDIFSDFNNVEEVTNNTSKSDESTSKEEVPSELYAPLEDSTSKEEISSEPLEENTSKEEVPSELYAPLEENTSKEEIPSEEKVVDFSDDDDEVWKF